MSERPTILALNLDGIPADLRERPQWVLWRLEWVEERQKWTKVPYLARNPERNASSTNPDTWASFEEAWAALDQADGIGFVLSADDPYVGLDLDDLAEADKGAIMLALDSYAERSVTKADGYHVLIRARLNGRGRHPAGLGVFDRERFFVVTGAHVAGTPETIEERQAELEVVLAHFLPPEPERLAPLAPSRIDVADEELLELARRARHGTKFSALYDAGYVSGYPSQSEADMALCSLLAFWTGRDPERIDRLVRSSGLYRGKWEREDYRSRTIERAIAGCSDVYSPEVTRASESAESPTDLPVSPGVSLGGADSADSPL